MTDLLGILQQLRRPSLLIRAARHGATEYNRNLHLRRLLATITLPANGPALSRLLELEDELNQQRQKDSANYSCANHIEVLVAMMGEARLLRASVDDLTPS